MSKRNILMTGATGLVGSRFVELYGDEFSIANMDLTTGVDITNKESINQFLDQNKGEVMIHLAAFTDTNQAFKESGDKNGLAYKVNVTGTEHLAQACVSRGIHLIHISTDFVFDGQQSTPYLEDQPLNPIEWYGKTKAIAEQVVKDSKVEYTILRISYPYRAHYTLKPDIVGKIRAGLESGKLYPQFADTKITPTLIDDIAQAFAKVIELKPRGTFHTVGSSSHSPYELARLVAEAYGFDPNLVQKGSLTEYLKTASRPFARYVELSNAKAVKELGLTFLDFPQGLAKIKQQQS